MRESAKYIQSKKLTRLGLQSFFLNVKNNHYDFVANKFIEEFEKKLSLLKNQIDTDNKQPGYLNHMEIYFLNKELFAISEMKIIYAYKHFEIHLKFLLKISCQEEESKFFKWKAIEDFLKSKKINPKEISNYEEMRDLRNLNNSIKHNRNILNNKTKNITEFHNKTELKYLDLLKFYSRVEDSGLNFLKSLSDILYKDAYAVDDPRPNLFQ